jgi:hypothetical protein
VPLLGSTLFTPIDSLTSTQQYSSSELAWGDINAWQAGDVATHPTGTTLSSFDALEALVNTFANSTTYPAMKNITVVGHGGGGQLNQRYAMVAQVSLSFILDSV